MMSSLRFNFSFTHAFNPLPLTSTFLFHDLSDWQLQISPPATAKCSHTNTNKHSCQELSITVFNSSCKWWLITGNLMVLYWHFNGGFILRNMMKICQMKQVNNYPFFSLHWKKKITKCCAGVWFWIDGWAAVVNFRNARLSHVLFSKLLCVFHSPICFQSSVVSLWNYCFLLLVLFVCSPCLPLCPLFVVGNISPGPGNDHI